MVASWLLSVGFKIDILNKNIVGPSFLEWIFSTFDCLASWEILFLFLPSLFPCSHFFRFPLYREESPEGLSSQKAVVLSWKPQDWRCKQWRCSWTEWDSGISEEPYCFSWVISLGCCWFWWVAPVSIPHTEAGKVVLEARSEHRIHGHLQKKGSHILKSEATLPSKRSWMAGFSWSRAWCLCGGKIE